MKICIFTDLHIADRGSQMKGSKQRLSYVEDFINWFCEEIRGREVDLIINCGDLTSSDNLSATEITALSNTIDRLECLGRSKHVFIRHILGNHERKDKEGFYNSLNFLNVVGKYGDFTDDDYNGLIRDFMVMTYDNVKLVFAPYGTEEYLKDIKVDPNYKYYAFTHLDFYDGMSNVTGLNPSDFPQYTRIFNGHVHNASEFNHIVNIGSCLGSNFSDDYSTAKPGIIILDTETGKFERIENPTAPLYFTVEDYGDFPDKDEIHRSYLRVVSPEISDYMTKQDLSSRYANVSTPQIIKEEDKEYVKLELNDFNTIIDLLKEFYKGDTNIISEIERIEKERK